MRYIHDGRWFPSYDCILPWTNNLLLLPLLLATSQRVPACHGMRQKKERSKNKRDGAKMYNVWFPLENVDTTRPILVVSSIYSSRRTGRAIRGTRLLRESNRIIMDNPKWRHHQCLKHHLVYCTRAVEPPTLLASVSLWRLLGQWVGCNYKRITRQIWILQQ